MKVIIVDNKSDSLTQVEQFCRRRKIEYAAIGPQEINSLRSSSHDLVILSGGIWYEDPAQQGEHYRTELEFIAKTNTPVLGICLGMQLIASAYGGELMKLKNEYHGNKKITLTKEGQEKIPDLSSDIVVYENHTKGVVESPPQFDVLARSEECIEIMLHKTLPILGMQFHPEKTQQETADAIWDSALKLLHLNKQ